MPRPSQRLDAALLASGRALYPDSGAAALSVRAVAEHAGVNPAMLHYHFKSKREFLRALLAQFYESIYASLLHETDCGGPAVERLRAALGFLARALREHRRMILRIWIDAVGGEPIAREFLQANAPRHLGVLFALMREAEAEGALRPTAPGQRAALVLGAVGLPLIFAAALIDRGVAPEALREAFEDQVASDAAIDERIDLVLKALAP